MLTCTIRRSGIRGLDLFLTNSPSFGLLWLEGWQVGQRRVCLSGWPLGRGLLLGCWLGGLSYGGRFRFVLHGAYRPNEAESVIPLQVEKSRMFIMQQDANLQRRLLHDSPFHPHSLSHFGRDTHCWWRGYTSWWRGAHHANGYRSCRRSRMELIPPLRARTREEKQKDCKRILSAGNNTDIW
jgi:hypothetical protein